MESSFHRDVQATEAVRGYLHPLPRSVIRPNAYVLLDGEWRFALDPEDRGLREHWYLGHEYHRVASWPGSVEEHLNAEQEAARDARPWCDSVAAWYERDFAVPAAWSEARDCLVQVTFGACGYETRAWLNGHPLRTVEDEEVHFGQYTSFSFLLPPERLLPVNRLTVRVADSLDAEITRGKQESRVYKRGGIWYQTISGPVRSIWLEPLERNHLRSRLDVVATVEDRLVEFELTTRVRDPGRYTLRLVVAPRGSGEPLAVADFNLPLEAGEQRQKVALELPGAALWSPAEPKLYHLVAQLISPSREVSQIEAHFGLRKIEARGRRIYLNNEPLYLDGILYQPATATFDEMRAHLLAMQALGCNLVRVHIAGVDPRIYELADELGLLLWVEVPSPHASSARSRANHRAELLRMLVFIGSHPSVIIWSLYNEDWGIEDIATNAEARAYITEVYAYMRLHHPQLLVVDNDGWQHVSTNGALESSLLTVHLYTDEVERWGQLLDRLVAGHNEGVAVKALVVGDPFFYQGQLPLVVSEWGGFGWTGYGGPAEPRAKAELIRALKRELRSRPIAGDVYTQATSIEAEVNGVIEPATGELLVPLRLLDSQ